MASPPEQQASLCRLNHHVQLIMKTNLHHYPNRERSRGRLAVLACCLLITAICLPAVAQSTSSFTYSGRLLDNGAPANGLYDMAFTLHSSETGNSPVGNPSTVLVPDVNVVQGLFTTVLDFGPDAFTGDPRWLEVSVGPTNVTLTVLGPRPQVRTVPQSSFARTAGRSVTADTATNAVLSKRAEVADTAVVATNAVMASRAVVADTATNATFATKAQTAVTSDTATNAVVAQRARSLDAGTYSNALSFTSAANAFAGSGAGLTSLDAAQLASGVVPDARLSTNVATLNSSPTFSGTVTAGGDVVGARLRIGSGHILTGSGATIAGGQNNGAGGGFATVGGGLTNTASADWATVAGGFGNSALENTATVGGGGFNAASGIGATVPGGTFNHATHHAFAAGYRAKANHPGAFVWADSTDADFQSTDADQFLIRASRGVGIGTGSPASPLHVVGRITTGLDFSAAGAITFRPPDGFAYFHIDNGPSGGRPIGRLRFSYGVNPGDFEVMSLTQLGKVGIGMTDPDTELTVNGKIKAHNGLFGPPANGINGGVGNRVILWPGTVSAAPYSLGIDGGTMWFGVPDVPGTTFKWFFGTTDRMILTNTGGVRFRTGVPGLNQDVWWNPGDAAWNFTSDRETKESLHLVDSQTVLEKLLQVPVSEWNYKGYPQRHIGPTAQDFHAQFPLNDSDTSLNTADLHGVALAAIQGLNQKVEGKMQKAEAAIEELRRENAGLKEKNARIASLEERIARLENLISKSAGAR
jgi:hypothetical protein